MAVMRDLNQHLYRRRNRWHYVRRVPFEYADFDPRGIIRKSLKTDSLEVARARRDALVEADEQFWATVFISGQGLTGTNSVSKQTRRAIHEYQAARQRTMAKGFMYTPVQEIAAQEDVADILDRLSAIPVRNAPDKSEADAELGTVSPPDIKISQALEIQFSEIAVSDQIGKSETQVQSWRKAKKRAVSNFVQVVDDFPMHKINRDYARKF